MSKKDLTIDPKKVKSIMDIPPPKGLKQLERFVGKVKWHTKIIKYMAHVACPLYRLTRKYAVFE